MESPKSGYDRKKDYERGKEGNKSDEERGGYRLIGREMGSGSGDKGRDGSHVRIMVRARIGRLTF